MRFSTYPRRTVRPPHSDGATRAPSRELIMGVDEITEATADLEEAALRPLRSAEEHAAALLAAPDFTYRHHWGPFRGLLLLTLNSGRISKTSNVFVSASETGELVTNVDPVPDPFVGSARYTVHNVAPFNGGVRVRLNVEWPDPLLIQVSYLVVNP
jgi:hypothetical protein